MFNSKNIVFLATGLGYGGAETQLVQVAKRLKSRGWNPQVVSMLDAEAYVKDLEDANIPVFNLAMRRGVPDPRGLYRLARILYRVRPDVVHSHMVHANLLARLVRGFVRVPVVVCTAHNISEGGRLRELAYRVTDPLCDITTQVSRAGMERYIRIGAVPRHKIRFVPNGVDTDRFRPDPVARARLRAQLRLGEQFAWLAVGRFERAKDYPNMLRAFAKVAAFTRAVLLIAGQGSLMEATVKLAAELGIANCVRFLGIRHDIPELMNAADAYVMSSAWEGMPMVLLEAAAVGLPIVATDVGGNREVVLDTQSGFMVPPNNANALAQAMLRLMQLSSDEQAQMGWIGRGHVEANYSLERVVSKWEALYQELLEYKRLRI